MKCILFHNKDMRCLPLLDAAASLHWIKGVSLLVGENNLVSMSKEKGSVTLTDRNIVQENLNLKYELLSQCRSVLSG